MAWLWSMEFATSQEIRWAMEAAKEMGFTSFRWERQSGHEIQ